MVRESVRERSVNQRIRISKTVMLYIDRMKEKTRRPLYEKAPQGISFIESPHDSPAKSIFQAWCRRGLYWNYNQLLPVATSVAMFRARFIAYFLKIGDMFGCKNQAASGPRIYDGR